MKITLHTITVADLVNGYQDNEEEGVVGCGGRLNIRPPFQREFVYNESQFGICPVCGLHYDISEMEGDHITPWRQGGRTTADNCQMLCRDCNRRKSGK